MPKGLENILKSLNKEIRNIEGRTRQGVIAAAIYVENESNELAPHDLGVLINSSFHDADPVKPIARVGYTALYAPAVHESTMKLKGVPRADFGKTGNHSDVGPQRVIAFGGGSGNGTYWDVGESKFLQKAMYRNASQILDIIRGRAKIK